MKKDLFFEPIALSGQSLYRAHLAQCPVITSDYSFINLWAWGPAYGLEWAFTADIAWLRQTRPHVVFWAPVGDWRAVDWVRVLKERPLLPLECIRVPEPLARIWEKIFGDRITLAEDRDQFDYLYRTTELISLSGNRYHKKRNLLRQFEKNTSHQYAPMTAAVAKKVLDFQEDWCEWRECFLHEGLVSENQAIFRVLENWENLSGVLGGCLMAEDRMAAYAIGEHLSSDTLLVHFEKGDPTIKGIYQAINQRFLAEEAKNAAWVNREQDLGEPGLRKAKESYQPSGFLKKYRVLVSG